MYILFYMSRKKALYFKINLKYYPRFRGFFYGEFHEFIATTQPQKKSVSTTTLKISELSFQNLQKHRIPTLNSQDTAK